MVKQRRFSRTVPWLAVLSAGRAAAVIPVLVIAAADAIGPIRGENVGGAALPAVRERPADEVGGRSRVDANELSGIVAALVALPMAHPASVPADRVNGLLLLCGLVIPVSFTLITLGPRYLPAHEVALIGLLETVLGPYLVWLVLDEHPGAAALMGGAIVLTILALHTLVGARRSHTGAG